MRSTIGGDGHVTVLLDEARRGDKAALDRLGRLIYPELLRIARARMRREGPGHLLQATALVHEVVLRFFRQKVFEKSPISLFLYKAAANAMHQVLVEHGRRRQVEQRLGLRTPVVLDRLLARLEAGHLPIEGLHIALGDLEQLHPNLAEIIELRFFGGLTVDQVARLLGVSRWKVEEDSRLAREWLRQRLERLD